MQAKSPLTIEIDEMQMININFIYVLITFYSKYAEYIAR